METLGNCMINTQLEDICKLYKSPKNTSQCYRALIIMRYLQGMNLDDIAKCASVSKRTAGKWITKFNKTGINGVFEDLNAKK